MERENRNILEIAFSQQQNYVEEMRAFQSTLQAYTKSTTSSTIVTKRTNQKTSTKTLEVDLKQISDQNVPSFLKALYISDLCEVDDEIANVTSGNLTQEDSTVKASLQMEMQRSKSVLAQAAPTGNNPLKDFTFSKQIGAP